MNTRYIQDEEPEYQHPQSYYDTNFYYDGDVIRRVAKNAREDDDGANENPLKRRLELIKVVKHFLHKKPWEKLRYCELIGEKEPDYEYEKYETYCICGENSQLFRCTHTESGTSFYMGTRCVKHFDPDFEPANNNGVCLLCNDNLRLKKSNKKNKVKNYEKNCKKICFKCLHNTFIKNGGFNVMLDAFKTFKQKVSDIKEKEKELCRILKEKEEKEENMKKKLEEQRHINILRMLRKQTNEMLIKMI
jgi:hypothetical protein